MRAYLLLSLLLVGCSPPTPTFTNAQVAAITAACTQNGGVVKSYTSSRRPFELDCIAVDPEKAK